MRGPPPPVRAPGGARGEETARRRFRLLPQRPAGRGWRSAACWKGPRAPRWRERGGSGQRSDHRLERCPGFGAELVAPLLVKAGLRQSRAKRSRVDALEDKTLPGQFLLERSVETRAVLALLDRGAVELGAHDLTDILRQGG